MMCPGPYGGPVSAVLRISSYLPLPSNPPVASHKTLSRLKKHSASDNTLSCLIIHSVAREFSLTLLSLTLSYQRAQCLLTNWLTD